MKKSHWRIILTVVSIVTAMTTVLGGLQPVAAKTDDPLAAFKEAKIDWQQAKGESITLMLVEHFWSSAVKENLEQFKELTGIDVVLDVYEEEEFRQKRTIALTSASETPDIFMLDWLGQYVDAGWVEPLDGYLADPALTDAEWYDLNDMFEGARNFGTYKDKFAGMPITAEVEILYYRKDLLEAKGLKVPETMDELYNVATALKSDDMAGIANRGRRGAGANVWAWAGYAMSYGGRVLDEEFQPVFNSPEAVAGTEMYAKLLQDAGPAGVVNYDWYEVLQDFQQGKVAMFTDSSGFVPTLLDKDSTPVAENVGFAAFPKGPGMDAPVPNGWYWLVGMNAYSQHKTAAWLFLEWATSKAGTQTIAGSGGSPTRASAWENPEFAKAFGEEAVPVVVSSLEYAKLAAYPYFHPKYPEFGDKIGIAIADVIEKKATAQEALDKAVEEAKQILE
jgi:multiple sugar transport system substrate-binding protein